MRVLLLLLLLSASVLAPLGAAAGAGAGAGAAAGAQAWTQEAYVWQRKPDAALQGVPPRALSLLDGVVLLAAEVEWRSGKAVVAYSTIEYRAWAEARFRRVSLAVRIGSFPGPFERDGAACESLCAMLKQVLRRAEEGGLRPAELQVDFDCAEAKLAGYAQWLGAFRAECGAIPLVFTALPSWLRHGALAQLAQVADGFVLQVHALELPKTVDSIPPLCDGEKAALWVEQAAALGRPFRVALPTYGHLLAFRRDGHYLGFSNGAPRRNWPGDARLRELRADEAEMAGLARYLRAQKPAGCSGLLWYRMPSGEEERNWAWPAFLSVLSGEDPAPRMEAKCIQKSSTTWEIVLRNSGEASAAVPAMVRVEWGGEAPPSGIDSMGGYLFQLLPEGGAAVFRAQLKGGLPRRLQPGRSLVLGWVRLNHGGEPVVTLSD